MHAMVVQVAGSLVQKFPYAHAELAEAMLIKLKQGLGKLPVASYLIWVLVLHSNTKGALAVHLHALSFPTQPLYSLCVPWQYRTVQMKFSGTQPKTCCLCKGISSVMMSG